MQSNMEVPATIGFGRSDASTIKDVTYTNASAKSIAANSQDTVSLTTSDDITGYTLLGVRMVQAIDIGHMSLRDFNVTTSGTASLVACNDTNSAITIGVGKAKIIARYMKD